jgi:hypothetical protein
MSILALIVLVIVFCLLWWAISLIPIGPPFLKNVLYILLILLAAIYLLGLVGIGPTLSLR